jgi:hypothetical protein
MTRANHYMAPGRSLVRLGDRARDRRAENAQIDIDEVMAELYRSSEVVQRFLSMPFVELALHRDKPTTMLHLIHACERLATTRSSFLFEELYLEAVRGLGPQSSRAPNSQGDLLKRSSA